MLKISVVPKDRTEASRHQRVCMGEEVVIVHLVCTCISRSNQCEYILYSMNYLILAFYAV